MGAVGGRGLGQTPITLSAEFLYLPMAPVTQGALGPHNFSSPYNSFGSCIPAAEANQTWHSSLIAGLLSTS